MSDYLNLDWHFTRVLPGGMPPGVSDHYTRSFANLPDDILVIEHTGWHGGYFIYRCHWLYACARNDGRDHRGGEPPWR